MNVTIREFREHDLDPLIILMKSFEDDIEELDDLKRIHYHPHSAEESTKRMLHDAKKRNGIVYIAEINNTIIGFIEGHEQEQSTEDILSVGKRKIGRIEELYVVKKYRSQGIGKLLMQTIEKFFNDNDFESITIGVFAPNKHARSFYAMLGYKERDIELLKAL